MHVVMLSLFLPADKLAAYVTRIREEQLKVMCEDMERAAPFTPYNLFLYLSSMGMLDKRPQGKHVPQGCAASLMADGLCMSCL